MTLNNPTQIRLGMTGAFFSRTYTVVGRAVLGELEDGEIYYWNEFNLETGTGESGTLVYEETDRGGEWRWFTLFDPEFPITAQDAATKEVGDPINLDGADVTVTLVRDSRVYRVEGRAAEGVKAGARANYFNAEAGDKMVVVSWTGDEVECYHGVTIRSSLVASAFNLRGKDLVKFHLAGGANLSSPRLGQIFQTVGIVLVGVVVIGFAVYHDLPPRSRPPVMASYLAPEAPLKTGGSGTLDGLNYRVIGHEEVNIAEVGVLMARHEYHLHADDGGEAWLIYGSKPGLKDWLLCKPLHPLALFTPQLAGNIRLGETVNVDHVTVTVSELFRLTVTESEELEGGGLRRGDVRYGFIGRKGDDFVLARWDEAQIEFLHGRLLKSGDVTSAFAGH